MDKIWRFHFEWTGESGIVIADSKAEALEQAVSYLKTYANDGANTSNVHVWRAVDDNEFRNTHPTVLPIDRYLYVLPADY